MVVIAVAAPAGAASRPAPCDVAADTPAAAPYVIVLSAFPAELAPLVEAADIEDTVLVDGRPYYRGRLDGASVVLGLTLIGMVNAETQTRSVLRAFEAGALVMSGVAGSHHRIGDVVVAAAWREEGRRKRRRVNAALLALARRGAAVPLEACTPVPPSSPDNPIVCMPHAPAVVFEDLGESGDDFDGEALACVPGAGEIFGCELPEPAAATAPAAIAEQYPDAIDMETAAVARVAAEHRVPFVAMRAVSDGAGDPLGDRGFPAQFFDYYALAARNAAAVTRAVIAELVTVGARSDGPRVCGLLAKGKWRRAARLIYQSMKIGSSVAVSRNTLP
jgi:nucleoside phosphorylase